MIEDDIYRTSSQYRLWSFTPESLHSLRVTTNAVASDRVRSAIQRTREAEAQSNPPPSTPNPTPNPQTSDTDSKPEIDCLTPEEEHDFVRYYCEQTLELGDQYTPPIPTIVRSTAIQYLRRFYLTNSPMTYHPKMIMSCALFLATKTENYYMSLSQFADGLPGDMSGEDVIKPEFLLMQGLRFTFDVKHPFRGLEGGIMELGSIARGMGVGAPWGAKGMQSAEELKRGLEGVVVSSSSGGKQGQEKERERLVTDRLARAHANTREILKTAAQMTDAYFLYTASQIWLAAFRIADESLMEFYLDTKFPSPGNGNGNEDAGPVAELREKLRRTISDSVALLQSYKPCSTDAEQKRNLKRIAKKRHHCANPRTNPSSAAGTAGRKREPGIPTDTGTSTPVGEGTSETEMERIAKKRKLEREQRDKEGNEVFGGELVTNRTKGQQQQAGTGAEAG